MSPTPVSAPTSGRPPPAAVTASGGAAETLTEDGRVRPLPPTEPGPDSRERERVVDRSPRPVPAPDDEVPVPARRAAHALIVMALEVVDRRRAPQNTRGAFPPHLMEMLRSLARVGVPGQHLGPARIHRIHIHAAGAAPGDTGADGDPGPRDYEVCATYARGPRLFAVAARIRVTPTGAGCTALRLV
ncbi:Rv3235 family protein [Dietzia cinnamea]|uniref:Rv3235 family protein n=1 Tax=Dietzia cinnamea TaxID=321318 RepID=UPI00223B0488|nr:Rv3235 family protein [Dietzia cinnamea]MCT2263772.1 Rv3235 family protein [Dietzia cinnamea]